MQLYAGVGRANLTPAINTWLVGFRFARDSGHARDQDTVYVDEQSIN